jgi:hypothetical protein
MNRRPYRYPKAEKWNMHKFNCWINKTYPHDDGSEVKELDLRGNGMKTIPKEVME